MKKPLVILFLLLLTLSFAACGEPETLPDPDIQPLPGSEESQSFVPQEEAAASQGETADTENGNWMAQFVSADGEEIVVCLSAQPMGGGFGRGERPEGTEAAEMSEGFQPPEGMEPGEMPEGEATARDRGGFGGRMIFVETESSYPLSADFTVLIDGTAGELSQLAEGDILSLRLEDGQVMQISRMQMPDFGDAPEEVPEEKTEQAPE